MPYIKKTGNPNIGRPTTNPRNLCLHLRLSQKENDMIAECAKRAEMTKTDVIMRAIALYHQELFKDKR